MTFETEGDFRYWLKVNGYTQDVIEEIAIKWNTISIINSQITDSVTQSNSETTNEISNSETQP